MEVSATLCLPVSEPSQVGDARRQAVRLAQQCGMGEVPAGRVALVATELAGNLVKHAGGGMLLVRPLEREGGPGVELLALDRGPGIADVGRALQDGFSTVGSPGTGLGAVGRLSERFQVYSLPGKGTALLAHVWEAPAAAERAGGLESGVVQQPKPGQRVCGDGWASVRGEGTVTVLVVDGLGHGEGAAEASREAMRVFRDHPLAQPAELLERMHAALRPTRGAAAAVAVVDAGAGEVRYAGVGNISAAVLHGAESRSLISHNGIVGHEMRRVQEVRLPWRAGGVLVMHSDGLTTRWSMAPYPGLTARHPSLIAGVLYRDHARGSDDATVAVVRDPA